MSTHADAQIIDALGGASFVAGAGGWSPTRVANWRHRGIPELYDVRLRFAHLAAEKGVDLPATRFPKIAVFATREPDPAALAGIIATLGGREVVSAGTRIADTVIEAMEMAGVIWSQHHRAFAEFALEQGFHLDPSDPASFRPLGRRAWDRRSA